MDMKKRLPFTRGYVLRLTVKHMRRVVDTSINKTLARIEELSGDREKSKELFDTLIHLNTLRSLLDKYQAEFSAAFKG